ncbi:MAG: preprotein translocase, YajC subunit [Ignavibacteria bacterium]|nr:preprotein translocase, YajC subunit [Ignavibacteria bacterium]
MTTFLPTLFLFMPPGGGQQGGGGSMVSMLVLIGGMFLIMYFLMIRPQQKRQKEHKLMLESVKKGDKIITTSGIHGTVTDMDDKTFELQVSDSTKMRFEKHAIAGKK